MSRRYLYKQRTMRPKNKFSFYTWRSSGVVDIENDRGITLFSMPPYIWAHLCKNLGLSIRPNYIGREKISLYLENLPIHEFELFKMQCILGLG